MFARSFVLAAGLACAVPASAGELKPEEARRFVAGKLFSYTCVDGTTGMGRIYNDGSVAGTLRPLGRGAARYVVLPPNTVRVSPQSICASVRGIPFEPCFNVVRTSERSFRGSLAGFGFAYCDFVRRGGRAQIARASTPSLRRTISPSVANAAER